MTKNEMLHAVAARNNYKMPEIDFDEARFERARKFANQVMAIVGRRFPDKSLRNEVDEDLICAAYIADAKVEVGPEWQL